MGKYTGTILALVLLAGAAPVRGQYYIQQGNYLDANNRLGSGGLNYGARNYGAQINAGNRLVSGNVAGGQAFRGLSPIRDPNSFYLGTPTNGGGISGAGLLSGAGYLPSDSLSSFRRDSANVADMQRLQSVQGRSMIGPSPYYAPGSTVANTGQIINRLNAPGTSQLSNPYESLRMDYRSQLQNPVDAARAGGLLGSPLSVEPRLMRADTGGSTAGRVNERLLNSSLFAGARQVPLSQVAAQTGQLPSASGRTMQTITGDVSSTPQRQQMLQMKADQSGTLMDRILRQQQAEAVESAAPTMTPTLQHSQVLAAPSGSGNLATKTGALESPIGMPERKGPGRMAVELPPLPTFVGTPDQQLNEQLAKGEELLQKGRYYDAARRYESAHAFDLDNPLPLFGLAMSLLAAGDYVSSANDLFAGIQFAGAEGAPRVELKRFVPDLSVLDKRRAFLEKQLETVDDFRLRFLLGWAEYMSGMVESGVKNMAKAAKDMPPQLNAVRAYVDALKKQAAKDAVASSRPS